MKTILNDSIAPVNPSDGGSNVIHNISKNFNGWEIAGFIIGAIVLLTLLTLMVLHIVKQIRGLKLTPSQKLEKHNFKIKKAQAKISSKQAKFDKKIAKLSQLKASVSTPSK